MCVSVWQRVGNGVFMQHVCMWWDISLSANTAPQNPLSLRCHREHTDTHNCSSLQHITVFKVCVPVWVGACAKVCESVTSLRHCGFKTLRFESKHCSKHKRGAEEQKQRRAHTHTQPDGEDSMRQSQRAGREREESGSDCDTEPRRDLRNEKKQRERSRSNEESQIAPHFFLFTCVRDTVPIIRCLFAPLHHPPPWCQKYYCYRGNWCVQGVRLPRCKRTNSPSGLFITPIFSWAHTRPCIFCPACYRGEQEQITASSRTLT